MNWKTLDNIDQLEQIAQLSHEKPCVIFKHSTRCSISSMAKLRLEDDWDLPEEQVMPYYLDLIQYRPISNTIAERFEVFHESPQLLLIKDGECIYDESHLGISVAELKSMLV